MLHESCYMHHAPSKNIKMGLEWSIEHLNGPLCNRVQNKFILCDIKNTNIPHILVWRIPSFATMDTKQPQQKRNCICLVMAQIHLSRGKKKSNDTIHFGILLYKRYLWHFALQRFTFWPFVCLFVGVCLFVCFHKVCLPFSTYSLSRK